MIKDFGSHVKFLHRNVLVSKWVIIYYSKNKLLITKYWSFGEYIRQKITHTSHIR